MRFLRFAAEGARGNEAMPGKKRTLRDEIASLVADTVDSHTDVDPDAGVYDDGLHVDAGYDEE